MLGRIFFLPGVAFTITVWSRRWRSRQAWQLYKNNIRNHSQQNFYLLHHFGWLRVIISSTSRKEDRVRRKQLLRRYVAMVSKMFLLRVKKRREGSSYARERRLRGRERRGEGIILTERRRRALYSYGIWHGYFVRSHRRFRAWGGGF